MIKKISVENFKSIVNESLDLGQFNVIIGENGCGKTNLLEAIAFAATASGGSLSQERLSARMRYVPSEFMVPAFDDIPNSELQKKVITIKIDSDKGMPKTVMALFDKNNQEWNNSNAGLVEDFLSFSMIKKRYDENPSAFSMINSDTKLVKALEEQNFLQFYIEAPEVLKEMKINLIEKPELPSFLIFSPEESKLRNFSGDIQIYPLGRRGEGLFQYLKDIHANKNMNSVVSEIYKQLSLLDWFDGASMPKGLLSNEYTINIGDKYLKQSLHYFDQRSANEGFLYLLFYLTLFISPATPSFFAIDNIETSFNPKLCRKMIQILIKLAKKHNKQVVITTHSPYVLDGLDLSKDEQRLFVARRNKNGHTLYRRVEKVKTKMPLSEVWMKGMIGGLPENF